MNRPSFCFPARVPPGRKSFRSAVFSRTLRALVAVSLAVLLGLSAPFGLAVRAQNSGDADPQPQAVSVQTTGQKDDASADPVSKSDGFIIHEQDGETFCRDATPDETRALNRRDPALMLRPINHLDEGVDAAGAAAEAGGGVGGMRIVLRATSRLDANPQAKEAFIRAAAAWEAVISSPITIVIDVDYGPDRFGETYPTGVLGSTGGQSLTFGSNYYATIRNKLVASASNAEEAALYNSLPPSAVPTDIGNITRVFVSSPILRALGELSAVANPATETNLGPIPTIGFNSNFPFDFNPADGIPTGVVDFDSVAVHEIGHVLGFTSDVGERELQPSAPLAMSMWDLFRVRPGTASPATFASVARILRSGGEHVHYDGSTELRLSTGKPDGTGGDGNQASHWKDDIQNSGQFIGIMDPTIRRGRHETINANDRKAIDMFGYSVGALPPAPANDDFAGASIIGGTSGTTTGTNITASKEAGEPNHANNAGGKSVWYRWTAPASGSLTLDTVGSSFDTMLAVYTGTSVGALGHVMSNDDIVNSVNTASRVTFNATAGTTYQIAVDGFNGSFGSVTLNWSLASPPTTFQFSSANYVVAEVNNSSNTSAVITVTRAGDTSQTQSVFAGTGSGGTATPGVDYFNNAGGILTFAPGETSKTFTVIIRDDTLVEPNETIMLGLNSPSIGTALGTPSTAVLTITDTDIVFGPNTVQFAAATTTVAEGAGRVDFVVTRTGDTQAPASVSYFTQGEFAVPGRANSRFDFNETYGTLRFAAGETSQTVSVLITDDAYVEGSEGLRFIINGTVNCTLGSPSVVEVTILDNDAQPTAANPVDDAQFFVRQHYVDFLNREPDAAGMAFWSNQINECGTDAACREVRRINASAAFFLSIEFQETGYLVYRMYQAAFDTGPRLHPTTFTLDSQEIGRGIVVNAPGWQQRLEQRKQDFAELFVSRAGFAGQYPQSMTAAELVDKLNANTGGSLSPSERNALVNGLSTGSLTRGQVVRAVAEDADFDAREKNRAFVMMQYLGYLRRAPDAPPNADFSGFNFWLAKLNQFGGNFVNAEMVKGFIMAGEYRERFGAQ